MHGTPKGQEHTVFANRIEELREQDRKLAEAYQGSGQRVWMLPSDLLDRDLLNVPGLHDPAFDRTKINTNYEEVVASADSPGTVSDVQALKSQIDYNASEERAFRFRHASLIRCMTHLHGRLESHRHAKGVLARVRGQVKDVLAAGG